MKIRVRLALLLGGLLAIFVIAIGFLQFTHREEARRILTSVSEERSELLDRFLAIAGQSLRNLAGDYGQWDEMASFARTRDAAWAKINIDASLGNFNAQAAWVASSSGEMIYATTDPADAAIPPPPFADPGFLALLQDRRAMHFFQRCASGLVEIRVAPILWSVDVKRTGVPLGWYAVGRVWDDKHLRTLSGTLQGRMWFGRAEPVKDSARVALERVLPDWRGEPLERLQFSYESRPLLRLMEGNAEEASVLYLYGGISLLIMVLALTFWVIRPVSRLTQALRTGNLDPIAELRRRTDEFGFLARQVAQSFAQRDALIESEEKLRQSADLRSRLARDLHDGIIQSIYAAGLGLEGVRKLQVKDPAAAEQKLLASEKLLGNSLWQVRNFIDALEPEQAKEGNIIESLTTLASTMKSLQPAEFLTELDVNLAPLIGAHQEMHLLQIAREALSNAVRHGGATLVRIRLQPIGNDDVQLEVVDDGTGFDVSDQRDHGRGLANLESRAREIGATLTVESAPGKGTRIAVRFRAKQ